MPPKKFASKAKKEESDAESSSSDSGPDDRNPPPSKKAKPSAAGSSAAKKSTGDEEPTWALEKNRLVKVREFKGRAFVDIREFYDAGGELRPGKKGISLTPQQWQKLKDIIPEVDEALKNI